MGLFDLDLGPAPGEPVVSIASAVQPVAPNDDPDDPRPIWTGVIFLSMAFPVTDEDGEARPDELHRLSPSTALIHGRGNDPKEVAVAMLHAAIKNARAETGKVGGYLDYAEVSMLLPGYHDNVLNEAETPYYDADDTYDPDNPPDDTPGG